MILKSLIENTTADPAMHTEHGLSLYIEANGRKILFDTGQSSAFADNAAKQNVDLSEVDFAVLSHAHYDHGGGLRTFLSLNGKAPVYVSRYAFDECLAGSGDYIGIDQSLRGSPRLVFVENTLRPADGLELFGGEGRTLHQPIAFSGLNVRRDGAVIPEDFRHEQYLLVTQGDKRVLISGCSHKGIVNIVHWFQPDVLVGGLHLMNLDPRSGGGPALDAIAKELLRFDTVFHACHCTGVAQYEYLKLRMQDRMFYLSAGQEITL
jgi:7,8-dihydropterin-6-yl-methyl-4-(beta-D-ribofuranosyl)aminobenzene 5'-phosphate synthase